MGTARAGRAGAFAQRDDAKVDLARASRFPWRRRRCGSPLAPGSRRPQVRRRTPRPAQSAPPRTRHRECRYATPRLLLRAARAPYQTLSPPLTTLIPPRVAGHPRAALLAPWHHCTASPPLTLPVPPLAARSVAMNAEQQVAAYPQAQLLAQYQAQQQQAQQRVASQQQQQYQAQQAQAQYGMGMQRNLSGGLAPQSGGLNLGAARMGNSFGAMPQQAMPQQGMPQSSYNPSNEILAMINKGHMGLPQGVPQPNVQGLAQAGLQGLGRGAPGDLGGAAVPPLGDAAFPSLGQRPGRRARRPGAGPRAAAVPGAPAGRRAAAAAAPAGVQRAGGGLPGAPRRRARGVRARAERRRRRRLRRRRARRRRARRPRARREDGGRRRRHRRGVGAYGLMGLLSVIRMTDQDLSTLALGTDPTTLGLTSTRLTACTQRSRRRGPTRPPSATPSSPSPSATTRSLPRSRRCPPAAARRPPSARPPPSSDRPTAARRPPSSPPSRRATSPFQLETLFYIFYNMPRDTLQAYAATELYNRDWRYHKDLKLWFTRASQQKAAEGAVHLL